MYWFARELFDGIQSSLTASSVLKLKLLFLVCVKLDLRVGRCLYTAFTPNNDGGKGTG